MQELYRYQRAYARFILEKALRIQAGQRVHLVRAPEDAGDFIQSFMEAAKQSGASDVQVYWQKDLKWIQAGSNSEPPREARREKPFSEQDMRSLLEAVSRGDAFVLCDCTCVGIFEGMSSSSVLRWVLEEGTVLDPLWKLLAQNLASWTMITVPTPLWAKKRYPHLDAYQGMRATWEDVLSRSGISQEDESFHEWELHIQDLEEKADLLNQEHFSALTFTAENIDLTVGLATGHRWLGPLFKTPKGNSFIPNIPMDEVFTAPHRLRVSGSVHATRPVVFNGLLIPELFLRFEKGRVVEARSSGAQELLDAILYTDDGASRLGEVALVPRKEDQEVYYVTLFDENASSHSALGRTYPITIRRPEEGGLNFLEAGGNESSLHVDFTIGSAGLKVDGISETKSRTAIIRDNIWVLPKQ